MANIEWIGTTTPGDLDVAANWVGGVAPGAADVAVFNAGSQDVDPSLGNIAAWAGMEIYSGYTGAIGGSGNELTTSVTTLKHLGSAALWFKDSAGTSVDVYIRCSDPSTVVNIGDGPFTGVHCMRGTITIAGDVGNITLLTVGMKDNPTSDVTLNIVANANTITDYYQYGGVVTAQMATTRAEINNGIFTLNGSVTAGRLLVSGGQVNHDSTGTITDMLLHGGRTDLGDKIKTITKSAAFPGSTLIKNDTIHTFTAALVDLRENVSGN
ncbi:hypothetical protein LCGC14_1548510 [marine sediment metagenome]|uniref:Uncharacterized protein n=1 Tax=marine sediment metagenome TaxID=412755 RepID=A0A0F9IR15_9ZZZZ